MLNRKKYMYSLVFFGAVNLMVIGCQPINSKIIRVDPARINWTSKAINELERINKKEYFSKDQLLAMIGEKPELQLKISELPEILAQDSKGDPKYIENLLQRLYYYYKSTLEFRSKHVEPDITNWRTSKRFNNLEIWLYRFNDPPELRIGGVFTNKTGLYQTNGFLVEDSRIISSCALLRSFK